jgi:CHASE3 domain sensor protein
VRIHLPLVHPIRELLERTNHGPEELQQLVCRLREQVAGNEVEVELEDLVRLLNYLRLPEANQGSRPPGPS